MQTTANRKRKKIGRIVVAVLLVVGILAGITVKKIQQIGFLRTPVYEIERPALPTLSHPAVLVFSKTNAFIHVDAIAAAKVLLRGLAARNNWSIFLSDSSALYNSEDLAKFDAVIWNNVTGDVLSPVQRDALRQYIEGGGGFIALHGAGDASIGKSWPWYEETLIGAHFIGHPLHPQFQMATLHKESSDDLITRHLPRTWSITDEWYSFAQSPRKQGLHILATLDESSYSPEVFGKSIRMGVDHPIIWRHCVGNGRVLYSALGHTAETYSEPTYKILLERAIAWAAGVEGEQCVNGVEVKREGDVSPALSK